MTSAVVCAFWAMWLRASLRADRRRLRNGFLLIAVVYTGVALLGQLAVLTPGGRALMSWVSFTLFVALFLGLLALPVFSTSEGRALSGLALRLAPFTIELLLVTALYRVVPHRSVALRHAFAGALLAAVLLALVKWGLGMYLGMFTTYQRLYGALAALPILMIWIYLGWVAVLLGAWYALTDTGPGQVVIASPYIATLLVLALASQRLRPPAAIGRQWRRKSG